MKFDNKEEYLKLIRSEFLKDMHNLLKHHKAFILDPFDDFGEGDAYDAVLDECQNLFVKWICEFKREF